MAYYILYSNSPPQQIFGLFLSQNMSASDAQQGRFVLANSFAAAALAMYEHILLLDQEVKEIWGRKITPTTILFSVNRYALLVSNIFAFLESVNWRGKSDSSCGVIARFQMVLNAILGIAAAVYAAMRVHALTQRRRGLTLATLLIGLVSPIIITVVWAASVPILDDDPPSPVCAVLLGFSDYQYIILLLASRVASLAADIVVVVLTLVKARRAWATARDCHGSRTQKVMEIFIQGGVLYFVSMATLNAFGIAIVSQITLSIVVPTWTSTLTSIIISRFILKLRSFYGDAQEQDLDSRLQLSSHSLT